MRCMNSLSTSLKKKLGLCSSDEEQTPVKTDQTTPTQDEIDAR